MSKTTNSGNSPRKSSEKNLPGIRHNVGARNPYAIAHHKLLSDGKLSAEELEKYVLNDLLNEAFGRNRSKLFDPRHGSHVYHGIWRATKEKHAAGLANESTKKALMEDPAGEEGDAPAYCQNLTRGALASTIQGKTLQYKDNGSNQGIQFNDPTQGCIADCWLLAPLASIAWCEQNANIPVKLARNTTLAFVSGGIPTNRKPITAPLAFYADNVQNPYYCRINPTMVQPGFYEAWPLLYEKCYTGYLVQNKTCTTSFGSIASPDYSQINYGCDFQALADLTGLTYVPGTTTDQTANYLGASPYDGSGIVEKIRANNTGGVAWTNTDKQFICVKNPTVAHTYLTSANAPNPAPYTDVVTYCQGLSANHSLSILGLYCEKAGDTKKYIVLRDPWALPLTGGSFCAPLNQAGVITYSFTLPATSITNPAAEGIFGIRSDYFMRYFEAFGWAQ